jgi:hypothetical protein
MDLFETGRWPSIYDKEALAKAIREITTGGPHFDARFYELTITTSRGGPACQGDVVELRGAVPIIDASGEPIVTDIEYEHWLIVGNTCDMHREEELHSIVAPLRTVDTTVTPDEAKMFRRYEYYKQFYVPPWPNAPDARHRFADFTQLVTIEKAAFREDCARIVARLQFPAWALLHACIVRFLARDDGRFD